MERKRASQLFELFVQTLSCCGMFLLESEPQDIEYYLFEEFDSDSVSFLHQDALNILLENDYISSDVYWLCRLLYEKFRKMEGTNLWNVASVKIDSEWHSILELSDKIKSLIKTKPGDGSVSYI